MKKNSFLGALGILICVAVIALLNEWDGRLPGDSTEAKKTPLIIAEDVYAQTFTEEGLLEYIIYADLLVEDDHHSTTTLHQPKLELYESELAWVIESNDALLSNTNKELTLTGNIIAQQKNEQKLRFETETLSYFTNEERMRTDTPVRIQQGANTTTAGGMEAKTKTGIVDLHKPVESRYVSE